MEHNYKEAIFDVTTGETTYRDLTAEEIAVIEIANAAVLEKVSEQESREAARQEILNKLGLTAEEASILLS